MLTFKQIKAQSSNAQAAIKDAVRPKISACFEFTLTTKTTGRIAACNRKICESLLEGNALHYKVYLLSSEHHNANYLY